MKVEILGVKIDKITMNDAVLTTLNMEGKGNYILTPNPEIIMYAQENIFFKNILNEANLLLPDGIGVVIASKILKKPLPERVAGFDFTCELFKSKKSFYLFGSKEGVAKTAKEKLEIKYPHINIVGTHNGYFTDDSEIIADINEKCPDILLVCLGAPKQEQWIYENKDKLNAVVILGVGGTLDVIAGNVKRAPKIWQKCHMEWLYRVIKEPSRIPRLASIPKFIIKVFNSKKGEK